jgi:LPXTG-site transpeptidase (sortase) family protein
MRGKETAKIKLWMLVGAAVALVALDALFWHGVLTNDVSFPAARDGSPVSFRSSFGSPTPVARVSVGVPVRIKIPSIALDAAIEKVALAADGSMDVPKQPLDAAWYELGPRPGEAGSAAVAGHVDWLRGASAAFTDLHEVRPGDKIAVLDDTGAIVSFVVRESRRYDAAADAIDVFSSNDGKAHLNLITCDGAWDKRAKQYSERLVVFADREKE